MKKKKKTRKKEGKKGKERWGERDTQREKSYNHCFHL